eukprot:357392-Chlamydomonas_euryale.AAC.18
MACPAGALAQVPLLLPPPQRPTCCCTAREPICERVGCSASGPSHALRYLLARKSAARTTASIALRTGESGRVVPLTCAPRSWGSLGKQGRSWKRSEPHACTMPPGQHTLASAVGMPHATHL